MPADRIDLERRLAAATDEDTSRGLNYTTLFGLVRDQLGEEAVRQVDVLGKGHRTDFFSYPVGDYLRSTWNALDRLEKTLGGVDGVLAELGRRTVTNFLGSTLGRTIFTISGRDPRRIVSAGPAGYRSAVSYGERTVEWLGPTKGRMIFKRDFMPPAFHRSVILAGLEASEARRPRVEARATDLLDSVYEIDWE
ncbi:MAG TPA: TIGR02265 family protein [Anaeromyxobacteraceae bacterium]|nr:TIGR02265 family protein [Anaeromyxobacteraceae bacterium]